MRSPRRGAIAATEELLDHGYKELTILAARDGEFALEPNALHIWPRGGFMLIALPNPDRTFTATLFLPHRGEPSFASIGADAVAAFFEREFPDAVPLMPALERDYASHPVGLLGTVHCQPWSFAQRILLVGDAAHAIVPFHGQGMNAAFEDCVVLDELIGGTRPSSRHDWPAIFAGFERRARAERARDRRDGARELPRDARRGARREVPAARGAFVRARAAFPGALHSALLDGDVSSRDLVRRSAAPRHDAGAHLARLEREREHGRGRGYSRRPRSSSTASCRTPRRAQANSTQQSSAPATVIDMPHARS